MFKYFFLCDFYGLTKSLLTAMSSSQSQELALIQGIAHSSDIYVFVEFMVIRIGGAWI